MNSSDLAYKKILEERVKDIDSEIEKLRKRDDSLFALHSQIENRISGLQVEREKLNEEIKNFTSREGLSDRTEDRLSAINDRYEARNDKQQEIQKRIDELKAIKSTVQGKHANKVLDRRIQRLEDKVNSLKSKKGHLVNIQRRIMYPKYRYMLKKQRKISLQEGKIANYQSMKNDVSALRSSLNEQSIFSPIANKIYERREAKYQRKIEKANEMINKIQNREAHAHYSGARRINLRNRVANRLRNMADYLSSTTPVPAPAPVM